MSCHAAQQIYFIGTRSGDEKVGVFYTGVYKRVHGSAVSVDCHDVVFFHRCFENALFGVDKRQVIALRR